MNGRAVIAVTVAAVGQIAGAEGIALPSCTNPDGSYVALYNTQDARYVTGLVTTPAGVVTTLFLDCGSTVGFEILDDDSSPAVLDANGIDVTPPSGLGIVIAGMGQDEYLTMQDIIRNVTEAGYQTRPRDPALECICAQEMRHALDL